MDIEELIAAESAAPAESEGLADPIAAHRAMFPLNQEIIGEDVTVGHKKSERVRLGAAANKLREMGFSVATPQQPVHPAQVICSASFNQSGSIHGHLMVTLTDDLVEAGLQQTVQSVFWSQGLAMVVCLDHRRLKQARDTSENGVLWAEMADAPATACAFMNPREMREWVDEFGEQYAHRNAHLWAKHGLTRDDARAWQVLGQRAAIHAPAWIAAGLRPEDAQPWAERGFAAYSQAKEWMALGVTPEQAAAWNQITTVKNVKDLMGRGITSDDAVALAAAGHSHGTLHELTAWIRNSRLAAGEPMRWAQISFTLIGDRAVREWTKIGLTVEDVAAWFAACAPSRPTAHEVQTWLARGETPEMVSRWRDAGITNPDSRRRWVDAGFTAQQAREWASAHTKLADYRAARQWMQAGFTAQEAATWAKADDTFADLETVQRWRSSHPRCEDPQIAARLHALMLNPDTIGEAVDLLVGPSR